jgi:hypothetical protein
VWQAGQVAFNYYTNIALLVSVKQMSTSTDNIDDNPISTISPTGIHDNAGAVHQDLIAHLLFNNTALDIPSQYICLLTCEPSFDPVHFVGPVAASTSAHCDQHKEQIFQIIQAVAYCRDQALHCGH